MLPAAEWRVRVGPVGSDETLAAWDPPSSGDDAATFVFAHGAGGHMHDRSVIAMSDALRARGIGTVRFNFLYRARGSGRPDQMPKLLECFTAVVERVRTQIAPRRLTLGGRSMGGRAASVLVAQGAACEGLLLLAYPLHPPGQPRKLRAAHLGGIRIPVLCVNGTRDAFCDRGEMERVLTGLGRSWRMHWIEGADHGFHVLKASGRTDGAALAEAADVVVDWLNHSVPSRAGTVDA